MSVQGFTIDNASDRIFISDNFYNEDGTRMPIMQIEITSMTVLIEELSIIYDILTKHFNVVVHIVPYYFQGYEPLFHTLQKFLCMDNVIVVCVGCRFLFRGDRDEEIDLSPKEKFDDLFPANIPGTIIVVPSELKRKAKYKGKKVYKRPGLTRDGFSCREASVKYVIEAVTLWEKYPNVSGSKIVHSLAYKEVLKELPMYAIHFIAKKYWKSVVSEIVTLPDHGIEFYNSMERLRSM